MPNSVEKIISGGQTGVDRAALDFAVEYGFEIGGYVPRGRMAEDGRINDKYSGLVETESEDPAERTQLNARHSDATLILTCGGLSGGSKLTEAAARECSKPVHVIDLAAPPIDDNIRATQEWLAKIAPVEINIAGPRASEEPAIYEVALDFLKRLFNPLV